MNEETFTKEIDEKVCDMLAVIECCKNLDPKIGGQDLKDVLFCEFVVPFLKREFCRNLVNKNLKDKEILLCHKILESLQTCQAFNPIYFQRIVNEGFLLKSEVITKIARTGIELLLNLLKILPPENLSKYKPQTKLRQFEFIKALLSLFDLKYLLFKCQAQEETDIPKETSISYLRKILKLERKKLETIFAIYFWINCSFTIRLENNTYYLESNPDNWIENVKGMINIALMYDELKMGTGANGIFISEMGKAYSLYKIGLKQFIYETLNNDFDHLLWQSSPHKFGVYMMKRLPYVQYLINS
jgi:hypothetical protein